LTADLTHSALCVTGSCDLKLWALPTRDRFARQFARAGISRVVDADDAGKETGTVIVVRADSVIDQPLVQTLSRGEPCFLATNDGGAIVAAIVKGSDVPLALDVLGGRRDAPSHLPVFRPDQLKAHFWKALRKRETPYALVINAGNQSDVEWRMFMGTYKGATDIITKHLWPVPAFHATRWLAPLGVTPNMVTSVGAAATVAAFFLFLNGHFLLGLAAAWLMTFLDTVDGKLARTTLTSSKWGDIFDHGIDLIHPPFWYIAWAIGLGAAGFVWSGELFWIVIASILGGYILQRAIEGIAIKWLGLEIHIWRPIDTLFRQITARRNPNLILLTVFALFGRPDIGLIAVAFWTVVCLLLHAIQLAQGFAAKGKSGANALESWMTAP
jgi:phosphatidylglycerophosphate synthase